MEEMRKSSNKMKYIQKYGIIEKYIIAKRKEQIMQV